MLLLHLFSILLIQQRASGFLFDDRMVTVQTNVGAIVGFTSSYDIKGTRRNLNTFLGIPFAEAPVGTMRFRKPVSKARFKTAFKATDYGPACLQLRAGQISDLNITFSEDCLNLNIFAPSDKLSNGELYPVMLYIHGGGYANGYSIGYEGGHLSLSGDVIVVTTNYRLNVFGFLSTGDSGAAGNYGLWDQQLAIQWVHDNIKSFGGDPNRITIFGESAGAGAVTFQTIYPGNKGLFQRAIAESGSFAGPWSFNTQADVRNYTYQFARQAGCLQQDSASIVTCLQTKSAQHIKSVMDGPLGDLGLYMWTPVIDDEFVFNEPMQLLTDKYPSKSVQEMFLGVDLIIGVNNKDGFSDFPLLNLMSLSGLNKTYIDTKLIPEKVKDFPYNNKSMTEAVIKAAVFEYTDWNHLDDLGRQVDRFADLITDYWFSVGASLTAQSHAENTSRATYVYKFSTSPTQHILPVIDSLDGSNVANHADDLLFIFGPWFDDHVKVADMGNETISEDVKAVGKMMITLFTNFAKSGNPNIPVDISQYSDSEWAQFNSTYRQYVEVAPKKEDRHMKMNFARRAVEFWTSLVPSLIKAAKQSKRTL